MSFINCQLGDESIQLLVKFLDVIQEEFYEIQTEFQDDFKFDLDISFNKFSLKSLEMLSACLAKNVLVHTLNLNAI